MTAEETPKKKRRWPRRLLVLFLAVVLLAGLLFGAMQTGPAKRFMASRITATLSSALPWPVEIRGIGGFLPFAASIERVSLGEADDPWLELQNTTLNLNVLPLLNGRVSIERIGAEVLRLHELPESDDTEEPDPEETFTLPVLNDLPTWIRLGQLQVDRLVVDEPVLGQTIVVDIGGSYSPDDDEIVQLNIRGLEDTDSDVSFIGGIRDGEVNFVLDVRDATLLPSRIGIEEALSFTVSAKGPMAAIDVVINAKRGDEDLASFDLVVAYAEPLGVTGTGEIALPGDLTPPVVLEKLGENVALDLDVTLTDGEQLAMKSTTIAFDRGQLALDGSYDISAGALDLTPLLKHNDFHLLTGQPREGDAVPMMARVPVQGTIDTLSLQPEVTVGGEPFLNGAVDLALGDAIDAQGEVTVHPAVGMTPAAFKDLLAEGAQVNLDVTYAEGLASFRETRVTVGKSNLTVTGELNTEAQHLDISAQISAGDLKQFEGLAGIPLGGATALELTASGDETQTRIVGTLRAENVVANTVEVPRGTLNVDVVAGAFPDGLTNRIEAKLDGEFPQFKPQADLARDLTIDGTVVVEALQRIQVTALDVSDGNLAVVADGGINLETRAADFTGTVRAAQIGDYTAMANLPYRGGVNIDVTVASGETPGSMTARIDGTLSGLEGLPAPADGLLDGDVALAGEGQYDGKAATLSAFTLASDTLEATGQGTYVIEAKTLNATVEGLINDLLPLSAIAGRPLSGAARFAVEADGPVDNLAAQGAIRGEDLNLDLLVADAATIDFKATGIPAAIDADAQLTLVEEGETLAAEAVIAMRDARININTLELSAGENALTGNGVFDTSTLRGHGELAVNAPNLASLTAWVNMPLEGSVALQAALEAGTDTITGTLSAENLVAGQIRLESAQGSVDVAQVFDTPSGSIDLAASNLDAGDVDLASLTVKAQGPPHAMDLDIKTEGIYQEFTRFNVDGGGQFSNETSALDLRNLTFGIEEYTFALRDASTFSWQEGTVILTPLVLESASGTIQAEARYGTDVVDALVAWENVSLRLVELAGIDPMEGATSGKITVTGTPEAPALVANATVADYRPQPDETIPGLNADLRASVGGGELAASATATVPDAADLAANADLPVVFTLSPFAFRVPDGGELSGTLKGNADLEAISPLLPAEGHAIKGKLNADLTARGAITRPRLNGAVTVADGYYENGSTSTILNDLAIRIEADGDRLRLTEFSANDTVGGTVTGEGEWAFRPEQGSPFDFTLTLDKPRLVYRDDMRADGSGNLRFSGDSDGAQLTGDVTVSPAYFLIPEGSGETKITTVEFRETGASSEEEEEERGAFAIGLDMTVNLPGRVFVTGTGLDSEWEGSLKVKNTVSEPAIEGVLRVKKGTLDFLGRVFSLADSTITFDGQTPPSPYLRIDAVTTTDEVTAHVRMEGVADSLNITLESEPPLPQDEILARVLFGQRLSDVSPVQALTLARYAPIFKKNQSGRSILGSQGPKPFLVDRMSLRSGTGAGDASIATGKYLNDDFYLEYEQGLGAAQSLISLEWLFAPQWSLKGKTTSEGQGGLGVFWKKEY